MKRAAADMTNLLAAPERFRVFLAFLSILFFLRLFHFQETSWRFIAEQLTAESPLQLHRAPGELLNEACHCA